MDGHALLFTDLVDSTAVVERLGDARAAGVLAEHDRAARTLLARHGGREIDHSDGFFLLFDDAVRAASFALAYHDALAALELARAPDCMSVPSRCARTPSRRSRAAPSRSRSKGSPSRSPRASCRSRAAARPW